MTSYILAFICGSLVASIAWGLYLFRVERMNHNLLQATKMRERRKAYAEGYQDRALLGQRHGCLRVVDKKPDNAA
jgi:ABC-type transport system involved in cytochrome c biogenesis permease subunit